MSIVFSSLLLPTAIFAQEQEEMAFGEEEASQTEEGAMTFDEKEAAAPAEEDPSEADILGDIGDDGIGLETEAAAATEETAPPAESGHDIWAVQQVYALRDRRLDLQPTFGFSMNDPYVQHQAISIGASYYITEVLAAGISLNFYRWLGATTDLNFSVSRATHQTVPINEYFWGGQINFTYVPLYGKFAFFKEWILHWDVWVIGGGGIISTRPIPVIDPEYRDFDFSIKFAFNVGAGGRLYLTRFLAIMLELRDYIFPEELENLNTSSDPSIRSDPDRLSWTDDNPKLTNNVMIHVGVSLFFPFTFDYELPK